MNIESSLCNSFNINSNSPFSSEIIPLLLEKYIEAKGTGVFETESKTLTLKDCELNLEKKVILEKKKSTTPKNEEIPVDTIRIIEEAEKNLKSR